MSRVAELWDEWADEDLFGDGFDALPLGGLVPSAVTFPTTRLVTRVLIALGADLTQPSTSWQWADITAYVRQDLGISWSTGRPDGSGQVGYGRATLKLDNRDGRFSRRNPNSPYYGLLTRNTPIWVTLDAGSGVRDRIQMFVNEWPVRWSDKSATDSTVTIQCSGALRRLGQGATLKSALRRGIPATSPTAYWPLEGGSPISGLSGGITMTQVGQVQYDVETGLTASDALPDFSGGGQLYAALPTTSTTNQWRYEFVARFGTGSDTIGDADFTVPVHIVSPAGTVNIWEVLISTGTAIAQWEDTSGVFTGLVDSGVAVDDGQWHHFRFGAVQSGADIVVTFTVDGTTTVTSTITSKTLDSTNSTIYVNPTQDTATFVGSVGHLTYWAPYASTVDTAYIARGYAGELATTRIRRIATEENLPMVCTSGVSVAMGPQPIAKMLDILRDAEAVDQGVLYETAWGLGFQSCNDRTNMPVSLALDYNQRHIVGLLEPADDDQRLRNRWTVSRPGGSPLTKEQTTGQTGTTLAGVYDNSTTVNVQSDSQLADQAGWRTAIGILDEDRWPAIPLNFTRSTSLIDTWTTLPFGQRMTVSNLPSQMPPDMLDLVIEGFSEAWTPFNYYASITSSPFSPYRIAIVDDPAALQDSPRVGSGSATLAVAINTTDTSLSVTTGSGGLWTTNVADFPLDINIGGERIRLSAISGVSSPQTFTVSARSVNGIVKAQAAGASVEVWSMATVGLS